MVNGFEWSNPGPMCKLDIKRPLIVYVGALLYHLSVKVKGRSFCISGETSSDLSDWESTYFKSTEILPPLWTADSGRKRKRAKHIL